MTCPSLPTRVRINAEQVCRRRGSAGLQLVSDASGVAQIRIASGDANQSPADLCVFPDGHLIDVAFEQGSVVVDVSDVDVDIQRR
jgi:hypothetical protein